MSNSANPLWYSTARFWPSPDTVPTQSRPVSYPDSALIYLTHSSPSFIGRCKYSETKYDDIFCVGQGEGLMHIILHIVYPCCKLAGRYLFTFKVRGKFGKCIFLAMLYVFAQQFLYGSHSVLSNLNWFSLI